MRSTLLSSLRLPHKRFALTLAGSAFGIAFYSSSSVLRNDSNNNTPWPVTQPSIEQRRAKQSANQSPAVNPTAEVPPPPSHSNSTVEGDVDDAAPVEDVESGAWASFSSRFAALGTSLSSIPWSDYRDQIADQIIPSWAFVLPDFFAKLQSELRMERGSLAEEVWQESQDPYIHPEIAYSARVRVGKELCADELAFIQRRKKFTTKALAKYLDVPESDVHPDDVPTIAICGSGGGLRALVAGASSFLSAQEAGLLGCATYTAGVSGSCWLQALYHSSLGSRRYDKVLEHLKKRIGVHIAYPPTFLELLTRTPTNKYLLAGTVERLKGDPKAAFGLVDVYGLLLATRLLVPRDELGVHEFDLKLSNQRSYVHEGLHPLPIYSAVRHEIPLEEKKSIEEKHKGETSEVTKEKAKQEAFFQWMEFTPFELWCEEFDAGIPAWSIGRHFQDGRSVARDSGLSLPEMRMPFLMGIWGSAFCATLAHYYKEIRPVVKGLTGFGGVDSLLEDRNEDLVRMHPIEPGRIPNYAIGMKGKLALTCPESVFEDDYLELMDAGMSNNLPIYPLLRPGRNIDMIICFDASADIKRENWLSVVDGYAKQRGIKGWPLGAGWPTETDDVQKELDAADEVIAQQAASKIAETKKEQSSSAESDIKEEQSSKPKAQHPSSPSEQTNANQNPTDLTHCNIWVGTTLASPASSSAPSSTRIPASSPPSTNSDTPILSATAGITLIYFPLLPNPKVADVDPATSPYLSTWNFVYTPDQIEKVVDLARANFEEGREETKRAVRGVWERKRRRRLEAKGLTVRER